MGLMSTPSIEGCWYAQFFSDYYSDMIIVCLLKSESDTMWATRWQTHQLMKKSCICSDSGTEFIGHDLQLLLTKYRISHETSAAFSSHRSDIVKGGWRTLRYVQKLAPRKLPDMLLNVAVQTLAHVRNRQYCRHMRKMPHQLFMRKQQNRTKLQKCCSTCFTYKQDREKKFGKWTGCF